MIIKMKINDELSFGSLIAKSFHTVHKDIRDKGHTHYWLKGGRGSAKSSFVSLEIVYNIMNNPGSDALVIRKVKDSLRDSVYEQLCWAVEMIGVESKWKFKVCPLEMIYMPTGQKILFRGADRPKKLKSVKAPSGYFRYIWYEELDEFGGMEEVDCINQSVLRGGNDCIVFYTYNPPKSFRSWVNLALTDFRADRFVHHSDYRSVNKNWLGERFLAEAEHLKSVNPERYLNEYLGETTGTGAEVFNNVNSRIISAEEIKSFDKVKRGIDWGYGVDPFVYLVMCFDSKRKRLFIFHEFYKIGARFDLIAEAIHGENHENDFIIAESAEPRSNDELRARGVRIRAAKKSQGSVEHGIKWLQDLEEIVIDPERCPNAKREFCGYELVQDKNGGYYGGFPDKNNHTIDTVRYALEDYIGKKGYKTVDRYKLGIY